MLFKFSHRLVKYENPDSIIPKKGIKPHSRARQNSKLCLLVFRVLFFYYMFHYIPHKKASKKETETYKCFKKFIPFAILMTQYIPY